ncbi:MAG: hypothetical protein KA165_12515 [Saprospiraceae bacterium]|nr:hypothetical protein [Saprospiraceae bacterium]
MPLVNQEFTVQGEAGEAAFASLVVTPKKWTDVFYGDDATEFHPSPHMQTVGEYPAVIKFTLDFYKRPWRFEFRLPDGQTYSRKNSQSAILIEPDTVIFTVQYQTT